MFTGMRQGELLGLSWDNVNFKTGRITIKQQLQCKDGVYFLETPKSGKCRVLSPAPVVMETLKDEQQQQNANKQIVGAAWENKWNLAFTDALGKNLVRRTVVKHFKAVIERIHAIEEEKTEYREYIEGWVHEIKAPITGIELMCENEKNELTRRIRLENRKIENYVDMALYYARSDEVYKDYMIKKTDLGKVAAEAVQKNKQYLIQSKMRVEIDCKDSAYTDEKWIGFILNQLILNSTKYRKGESPYIYIFTQRDENGTKLMVQDNGIGVKMEEKDRIFEKGFTGSNGRNTERSTGMGLYLCQKLCRKLGIGILAESKEGEGTKVILTFPVSSYLTEL